MSRNFQISHPGSYTVVMDGALIGTYPSQSYFENLVRADPTIGRIYQGYTMPTMYTTSKTVQVGPTGNWKKKQYGRIYSRTGDLFSLSSGSNMPIGWSAPGYSTAEYQKALYKAYGKLKDLSGSVNFATNLGEAQQSIDLITAALKKGFRALKAARKGALADARRELLGKGRDGSKHWRSALRQLGLHGTKPAQNLSGRVLQFNLGIKPLASDIHAAIVEYGTGPATTGIHIVKGSSGNPKYGPSRIVIDSQGYVPMKLHYQELNHCRIQMYVEIKDPTSANAAAAGMTNPAALAWELLGLSCFVDYALNVGGWLNAIDAPYGWNLIEGSAMLRTMCRVTFSGYSPSPQETSTVSGYRESFRYERRLMGNNFPFPPLPEFKNPVTLTHALNAVALFGSRLA